MHTLSPGLLKRLPVSVHLARVRAEQNMCKSVSTLRRMDTCPPAWTATQVELNAGGPQPPEANLHASDLFWLGSVHLHL
jgi:hypothetical protein